MILIVGLGNPGRKYDGTRHNLGSRTVEALRRALELSAWEEKPDWECALVKAPELMLCLPRTFMNDSGRAVERVLRWYNIPPERLWVISDDVDLPFLETRIRHDGSAGGHKGLQSIIDVLKTEVFHRFRIGIGSNRDYAIPAEVYVLEPFSGDEERLIAETLPRIVTELRSAIDV